MHLSRLDPRAPGGLVALVASIYLGVALAWVHPRCAHAPRWGCANLGDGGSRHRRANGVHGVGPLFDSLLTRWGWNEGWRLLSSVHSELGGVSVVMELDAH